MTLNKNWIDNKTGARDIWTILALKTEPAITAVGHYMELTLISIWLKA